MVLQPHPLLMMAIEERRMIRFVYHQKERIVEPHDHGIRSGSVQLLGYQIRGFSSRPLPNWLTTKVDEISEIALLAGDISRRTPNLLRKTPQMGQAFQQSETGPMSQAEERITPLHLF